MFKSTPQKRVLLDHDRATGKVVYLLVFGVFLIATLLAAVVAASNPTKVSAATNTNLNFQARLQTNGGAIVPDGFYNVEFKLYNAAAIDGGETLIAGSCTTNPGAVADEDCLWTERWYDSNGVTAGNDNRVRVKNGYLTVNLGAQTAFGSTINWDQDLWIGINIGGTTQTATPTFDGEMTPRLKLTAVPYAFRAAELAKFGGTYTSVLGITSPTVGNQTFNLPDMAAAGTYTLLNNVNGIQNQTASPQTGGFNLSGNGLLSGSMTAATSVLTPLLDTATAVALNIGTTNATVINLNEDVSVVGGKSLTMAAGIGTYNQTYNSTSAGTASTISLTNASGTQTNGLFINRNGSGGTTTNGINVTANAGTLDSGLRIEDAAGTITNGINLVGSFATNLITSSNFTVSAGGAITGATGLTLASGNFVQSGSGTFATGTGTVSLNGATTVAANLTVTNAGNVAFQRGSDFSTTGTTHNANLGTGALVRLTGASAQTITGITNGADGRILTIINAAGQAAIFNNNDALSTAANRIITGTGSAMTLAAGATTTLVYDSGASFWRVVGDGGGGSSGVTTVGSFSGSSIANGASISTNTITFGPADATNPGMMSTGNQTFAGTKDFASAIFTQAVNSRGYITSDTGASDAGKYTKLGTCTITAQYQTCRSYASVVSAGEGDGIAYKATVDFKVKQQNALGGAPLVAVDVSNTNSLTASDFTAVTTQNNGTATIVELWGQIDTTFQSWAISPIVNASTSVAWLQAQGFSASLPVGTQTAATYNAGTFTDLTASGNFVQSGSGTFSTAGGAISLNGSSITLGDASTDRVTFTAQITGGSPIVLQGATDNSFTTTLALTDPTSNRTITLPNASGTVAVSASGNIALSAAGAITLTGQVGVANGGTGLGTVTQNGIMYGNGTSNVGVTAAGTTGQCLIATTSAAPSWGTCDPSAGTLQDSYDASGTTNPQIQLNGTNGGLKLRDHATPVSGNLFQIQNSGGTATYFGVATAGMTIQNSSAVTLLNFNTSTSTLRIAKTAGAYVDIYHDGSNAYISQATGTLNLGSGSGNVSITLSSPTELFTATQTANLSGTYSSNSFSISQVLTGGANAISGSVLNISSTSTTSSTNTQNILYLNKQNGTGGNLILAQTGGSTTRFSVSDAGLVTATGGLTITGAAVNLNASSNFATNIGTGTSTGTISIGTGTGAKTVSIGNVTGATGVDINSGSGGIGIGNNGSSAGTIVIGNGSGNLVNINAMGGGWQIGTTGNATLSDLAMDGNFAQSGSTTFATGTGAISLNGDVTVASGKKLTLGSNSSDPSGSNGAMYYNSGTNKFRCYENGAWTNCLSPWTTIIKPSDEDIASTSTLQADDHLQFSVTANTTYVVRFNIAYSGSNTSGDYECQFQFPAATATQDVVGRYFGVDTADAAAQTGGQLGATTGFPSSSRALAVNGTLGNDRMFEGTFTFRPASSGTMNFMFALASGSSGTARTTAGSMLEYRAL